METKKKEAIDLISNPQAEGMKLYPYLCQAGVPTIGIGTTTYPDGTKVQLSDSPITATQAYEYCEIYLKQNVFPKVDVLQKRFCFNDKIYSSICSLLYNIPSAINGESFQNALREGDIYLLAESFRKYNKVRKNGELVKSTGLTTRRELEIKFFLSDKDWK